MTADATTFAEPQSVLILHGWQHDRPQGHWLRHLGERLEDAGHQVVYPQLPDANSPSLAAWLDAFDTAFARLEHERTTIVTHSLGGLLVLQAIASRPVRVHRLLMVAPPDFALAAQEPAIAEFAALGVDGGRVRAASEVLPRVVASDNDPWGRAVGARVDYADRFGLSFTLVPGQAHFTIGDGYGAWPSAEEWVLSGRDSSQIVARGAGVESRQ